MYGSESIGDKSFHLSFKLYELTQVSHKSFFTKVRDIIQKSTRTKAINDFQVSPFRNKIICGHDYRLLQVDLCVRIIHEE